ncbi:MAG: VPLPA-CTERM sorting domain-containing protein [Pseudomonadota bacterium]
MKNFVLAAAVAASTSLVAMAAQAATFFYELDDHPNGGKSGTYDYGLRLDREDPDMFFSLSKDNGAEAFMEYDSVAGTAILYGTMVRSLGNDQFVGSFTFRYDLSGLTDHSNGGFIDTAGNGIGRVVGAGVNGGDLALGNAAKSGDPYDGEYFRFGLDALSNRAFEGFEGTGWVQSDPGANDFLFTASVLDTPPPSPQISAVPLPAAAWLLLAGLGAMGAMRRQKSNG